MLEKKYSTFSLQASLFQGFLTHSDLSSSLSRVCNVGEQTHGLHQSCT